MAPTGRRRCVVPILRNSIENSLRKLLKTFERDPTVESIVMDLLTRFSSVVDGMALTGRRRCVVPIPRHSIENRLGKLVKTFERDPTVGSRVIDLFARFSSVVGAMAPTGRRWSVVPIPCNSIKNRIRKLVKKI